MIISSVPSPEQTVVGSFVEILPPFAGQTTGGSIQAGSAPAKNVTGVPATSKAAQIAPSAIAAATSPPVETPSVAGKSSLRILKACTV